MFGTSGVRGTVGTEITAALALDVGRAVVTNGADTVVVGRDARDSGRMVSRALITGVIECGGDAVDLGVEPTPTVARTVVRRDADAGIVVTASHNPAPDNGIKLWSESGQAFDDEQNTQVAETIRSEAFTLAAHDTIGTVEHIDDARKAHRQALEAAVSPPEPQRVIVDVGNGVGRLTADALHALGCDVETLNAQRDSQFPGRPSEPTAEHCQTACEVVSATGADVGIVHDGDADRMLAIDEHGRFVTGDLLLALFARWAATAGERVAVPINTSLIVADVLSEIGADVTYTPVGDTYIAAKTSEPAVVFGGEPSGAWIWPDETRCPDGPLAACKLIELVAEHGSLAALVDALPTYPIRRDSIRTDSKTAIAEAAADRAVAAFDDVSTLDGVRIKTDDGWFLIRASGTEPLIRVTAEARDPDAADALLDTARELVDGVQSQ